MYRKYVLNMYSNGRSIRPDGESIRPWCFPSTNIFKIFSKWRFFGSQILGRPWRLEGFEPTFGRKIRDVGSQNPCNEFVVCATKCLTGSNVTVWWFYHVLNRWDISLQTIPSFGICFPSKNIFKMMIFRLPESPLFWSPPWRLEDFEPAFGRTFRGVGWQNTSQNLILVCAESFTLRNVSQIRLKHVF